MKRVYKKPQIKIVDCWVRHHLCTASDSDYGRGIEGGGEGTQPIETDDGTHAPSRELKIWFED